MYVGDRELFFSINDKVIFVLAKMIFNIFNDKKKSKRIDNQTRETRKPHSDQVHTRKRDDRERRDTICLLCQRVSTPFIKKKKKR